MPPQIFKQKMKSAKGKATAISEIDRVRFSQVVKDVRDSPPGVSAEYKFPSTISAAARTFIHGLVGLRRSL
jgi:hypothetical protein